jgi:hypothetical protein
MKLPSHSRAFVILQALVVCCCSLAQEQGYESSQVRQCISLRGPWLFQRDGAPSNDWKTVTVPSSFETHEGADFDGVGWYRKVVAPFALPKGKRVLLHFQAAATETEVWWNGEKVGGHLGGWTPFRFDATDLVRKAKPGQPREIKVRLDEKVGHNTQGFLPVIAPHFGGLWQEVQLLILPETCLDDLRLSAIGNPKTGRLVLELPVIGAAGQVDSVTIRYRLIGSRSWNTVCLTNLPAGDVIKAAVPMPEFKCWSPAEPNLYELEIELPGSGTRAEAGGDVARTRAAFRSIDAFGTQLRLNNQPLAIRGLLNWGYYAPLLAPRPVEERFRREIALARAHGFNLMKFCLWVPPKRCLELADELGFLAWMEYPTWHPTMTEKFRAPLRQEYGQFFYYDRIHPSVVLRSLTCETGSGAELAVIKELYDLAHAMIPGAMVEDDSSWIAWNRVHDFYDDHPYGNNHTWVATLRQLNEYILAHGPKPLVLGEAIAADTWVNREPIIKQVGLARPFWVPDCFDDQARWMDRMRSLAGPAGLEELAPDSLQYAMLMRKFQVEAYRREIPYGGYVISVIRDISSASMGLLDYFDQPKWTDQDWAWHRDTVILLETEADRRSFFSSERFRANLFLSHFGPRTVENAELTVSLDRDLKTAVSTNSLLQSEDCLAGAGTRILHRLKKKGMAQNPGAVAKLLELDFPLPEAPRPTRLVIRSILKTAQGDFHNEWPIWVVPQPSLSSAPKVWLHSSLSNEVARELFPGAPGLDTETCAGIVVAARFDDQLVRELEGGGRVLLLPDGQKHSLPLQSHWFMRGGPYISGHPIMQTVPRDLFVELQHFDLASEVIPEVFYLDAIDPILMLWDTHTQKSIKTHGLIFETQAGKGRLLVSALRHQSPANAAGQWLLGVLRDHLASGPPPSRALSDDLWQQLKTKLHEEKISLMDMPWRFKPDPKAEGVAHGWHLPVLTPDDTWREIRIGRAWEAEGYPLLDGWAWYRLAVGVPARWQGQPVYLSFEGVDDIYELYINGKLAGKGGDLATRQNAFDEKKSHNISALVEPGADCLIAVRVYDWYGAGGIFRPVTLGTSGFGPSKTILKE